MELYLRNRDEMYIVNLGNLIYLEADDHYTYAFYATETRILYPFSLSRFEAQLVQLSDTPYIIRVGRRYMINLKYICRINNVRQEVMFFTNKGTHSIKVSKDAVKELINVCAKNIHS